MNVEERIPRINWPQISGLYKIVQLEIDGNPYLKFGQGISRLFHASILQEVLTTLEIPYDEISLNSHQTGMIEMGERRLQYTVPSPRGTRYDVIGMGFALIDLVKKEAEFYGESDDYRIPVSKTHLDKIRSLAADWNTKLRS